MATPPFRDQLLIHTPICYINISLTPCLANQKLLANLSLLRLLKFCSGFSVFHFQYCLTNHFHGSPPSMANADKLQSFNFSYKCTPCTLPKSDRCSVQSSLLRHLTRCYILFLGCTESVGLFTVQPKMHLSKFDPFPH